MSQISIIVPVYNVENVLRRCLNSILEQTYLDFELILVDDGSKDLSGSICDKYADKDNRIIVIHKENGGLSSARNAGIEVAAGKYIMFVDADDLIHFKAIELEIAILEENDADILICPLKRFSKDSEINPFSNIEQLHGISVISGLEAEKGFFNNPSASMYVSSCGKVFKRMLFDDIRFPEGRLFEDEFTTYKLYYKSKKIVVVDTALYFYFINSAGITQNLDINKRFDEYDAKKERLEFFRNNGQIKLYHLALMDYLHTAQWDLIDIKKKKQKFDHKKGVAFQQQYVNILKLAEMEKAISFTKNYDYYVLAYPEKKTSLRIKRFILKAIGKMK